MNEKIIQTTIRLPAELREKLQQEADKLGIPSGHLATLILCDYINSEKSQYNHQYNKQ